jgi:hypothetical protein
MPALLVLGLLNKADMQYFLWRIGMLYQVVWYGVSLNNGNISAIRLPRVFLCVKQPRVGLNSNVESRGDGNE